MTETSFTLLICDGEKKAFTDELTKMRGDFKRLNQHLKQQPEPTHIPVRSGKNTWVTPDKDVFDRFIRLGICETVKQRNERIDKLRDDRQVALEEKLEKLPITLEEATEGLCNYAEYFVDIATDQMYIQEKNGIITSFKKISVIITKYFEHINENSSVLHQELSRRMEARALTNQFEMFTRMGFTNGNVYYQLDNTRCVEITFEGWNIIDSVSKNIKFRPVKGKRDQVTPIETDKNISDFMDLFRCKFDSERFTIAGALIAGMLPHIDHPVINVYGDKGSGKSTIANGVKLTIDPVIFEKQGFQIPNTKRELLLALSQHPCMILDNLSYIKDSLSDIISAAVTGVSIPNRKLYTDDDMLILSMHTFAIITGLVDNIKLADLRSRSVKLTVHYTKKQSMTSEQLRTEFDTQLPEMLGAIFNHVAEYLDCPKDFKPPSGYRLTDYYKILCIISGHFGLVYDDVESMFAQKLDENREIDIYTESIGRFLIDRLVGSGTSGIGKWLLNSDGNKYFTMSKLHAFMREKKADNQYHNATTLGKGFARVSNDLALYGITMERKSPKSNVFTITYAPECATLIFEDEKLSVGDINERVSKVNTKESSNQGTGVFDPFDLDIDDDEELFDD